MVHSHMNSCFLFVGCLFAPFCLAHRLTYIINGEGEGFG